MKIHASLLPLCFIPISDAFVTYTPLHSISSVCKASSCSSSRRRTLRCNADIEWTPTKVLEASQLAEGQYEVKIEVGDLGNDYKVPGQYVQIKVEDGDKPGFYAIASPPGDTGTMEFLVKETDRTKSLCTAKTGSSVQMSRVMGNGFPIEEHFTGYKYDFPIQNVVLAATGTGIAPFRAAIEAGVLEESSKSDSGPFGRSCKLYWGVRNEKTMPWADKLKEWDERGVEVVPVLSQPGDNWKGRTGYIQQAIKEDGIRVPRNTGILLCGHPEMGEEVKVLAVESGVNDGRILTNF